MLQFLIGPSRVGRTIGTRTSIRRPPRTTPSVIVLPMRTSEISPVEHRRIADVGAVGRDDDVAGLEAGLALELLLSSRPVYTHPAPHATSGSYPIASSERRAFRRTGARSHVEPLRGSDRAPVLDDVGVRRQRESVLRLNKIIAEFGRRRGTPPRGPRGQCKVRPRRTHARYEDPRVASAVERSPGSRIRKNSSRSKQRWVPA